jgi:hypothetical protein
MRTAGCREKIDFAAAVCGLDSKTVAKVKSATGISEHLQEKFPQICELTTDAVLEFGKKANRLYLDEVIPVIQKMMERERRVTAKDIRKVFSEHKPKLEKNEIDLKEELAAIRKKISECNQSLANLRKEEADILRQERDKNEKQRIAYEQMHVQESKKEDGVNSPVKNVTPEQSPKGDDV